MDTLDIFAKLERVQCLDAGESGHAEPYLWTVFFKIDGSTCRVAGGVLAGTATVVGTTGSSHRNLAAAATGDMVAVPPSLGEFRTWLFPIAFDPPLGNRSEVGGVFGIVAALMEQDGTSEHDVNAGRVMLTKAVKEQLDILIPTLTLGHQEPDEDEIKAIRATIGAAVRSAISDEVTAGEFVAAFGDMDDEIGSAFFRFSQASLMRPATGAFSLPFEETWNSAGKWKISGHLVCQRPATPVVYADRNYAGASQSLPAGRYNVGQLTIGNDRVSSIRVPPGWSATIFAEAGFVGDADVVTADTPRVGPVLNDRTSSIIVEGPFVTIYTDIVFQGRSQILHAGAFDVGQLTIGNDQMSSVRVPPGWSVTLFAEAGFRGDSVVLTVDTPNVAAILNDRTSSIIVEGPFVTIHADRGFLGESQMLRAGSFDVDQLTIGNDRLSSIRVPRGWEVTLFRHAQFTGEKLIVKADRDYVGDEMENRTSSIIVRPVLVPPIIDPKLPKVVG